MDILLKPGWNFLRKHFWIPMRNLPLACMNAKRDNQIKQTLGLVLDNDVKEDDNG